MNSDILKGNWKEIKGEIKRKWGRLTDDELTEISGAEESLIGSLQKNYGYSKEQALTEYNKFMSSMDRPATSKKREREL